MVEMMIVIAILGLMTSIFIPASRRGERRLVLAKEQAFLVGVINRARNLAVQKIQRGNRTICGWGVYVDVAQNRYALFADAAPGAVPGNADCDQSDSRYSQGEATEWFTLDTRVQFQPTAPPDATNVLFIAPEQFVYVNGCSPSPPVPRDGRVGGSPDCPLNPPPPEIRFTLAGTDGSAEVVVNKAGQVYTRY